jgi:hypothetical protein
MRVLVCGGRNHDVQSVLNGLDELEILRGPIRVIIHGASGNTDYAAGRWAMLQGIKVHTFKAAGPIRNQRMIDEGKPDLVVAFTGGYGTADMTRRAIDAGIEVIKVFDDRLTVDQQDEYEERSAIMQFDACMTKEQAESEAMKRIKERERGNGNKQV